MKTKKICSMFLVVILLLAMFPSATLAAAKPSPPKGLKCAAVSATSLTVSWKKVSKAKKYTVYQKKGSKFKKIASPKKNTFTVKKLKANTKYSFKVTVTIAGGTSKQSKAVSGKTKPAVLKVSTLSGSPAMLVNGTCTLGADFVPADPKKKPQITWSTDKPAIATIDAEGVVIGKSIGVAAITATTDNGKVATYPIRVCASVASISFNTTKQPTGTVSYDLKEGKTVPMFMPKVLPENAYCILTFTSNNPTAVDITSNSKGDYFLKCKAPGTAFITAKSHNNVTSSFVVNVKPQLTNATIPASYTMAVCSYWTPVVTLTPSNGLPDYELSSSNTNILRVEQNSKVYSIKPGTAQIKVKVNGVVKSTCDVTVSQPPALTLSSYTASTPGLKYYNVKHEDTGKATVSLGVVPINGAAWYWITEHVNYTATMTDVQLFQTGNIRDLSGGSLKVGNTIKTPNTSLGATKRSWRVEASEIGQVLNFTGVDTGLRFYSVAPYNASNIQITNNVFVGRVPALYHPRNVGGPPSTNPNKNPAADGYMAPLQVPFYMPSVGNFMLGGDMWLSSGFGMTFFIPSAPWALRTTFDKIPGAAGYDMYVTCNGKNWGSDNIPQPAAAANRCMRDTGFVLENGDTIVNILPYVLDINGSTKLYGEMRTVIFKKVDASKFYEMWYWEDNAAGVNNPVLLNDFTGM